MGSQRLYGETLGVSLQKEEGTEEEARNQAGLELWSPAALVTVQRPGSSSFCCHPPFLARPHPLHARPPSPAVITLLVASPSLALSYRAILVDKL